jgi:hypothetical protein
LLPPPPQILPAALAQFAPTNFPIAFALKAIPFPPYFHLLMNDDFTRVRFSFSLLRFAARPVIV